MTRRPRSRVAWTSASSRSWPRKRTLLARSRGCSRSAHCPREKPAGKGSPMSQRVSTPSKGFSKRRGAIGRLPRAPRRLSSTASALAATLPSVARRPRSRSMRTQVRRERTRAWESSSLVSVSMSSRRAMPFTGMPVFASCSAARSGKHSMIAALGRMRSWVRRRQSWKGPWPSTWAPSSSSSRGAQPLLSVCPGPQGVKGWAASAWSNASSERVQGAWSCQRRRARNHIAGSLC